MDPTSRIICLVLKDCNQLLVSNLSKEIVAELYTKDCISLNERRKLDSYQDPVERNENIINILMTK